MSHRLSVSVMLLLGLAAPKAIAEQQFIDPVWAYQRWGDGSAIVVDVREDYEIADGMASPALWIPTSTIQINPDAFATVLSAFTASRQVIFYCGSGVRAAAATQLAIELGYDAANMGGYSRWVDAALPTRFP